ncbi:hypothetical protein SUGI_0917240 [Cryptomeria japonica]|nr:hypothetical protein SUGI_0917240 [Cryptomeria japonica]
MVQAQEIMAGGIGLKAFCTVCILIAIVSSVSATNSSKLNYDTVDTDGFRAELEHIDSQLISIHNITWLQRAVERSKQRLQSFTAARTEKTKAKDLGASGVRGVRGGLSSAGSIRERRGDAQRVVGGCRLHDLGAIPSRLRVPTGLGTEVGPPSWVCWGGVEFWGLLNLLGPFGV